MASQALNRDDSVGFEKESDITANTAKKTTGMERLYVVMETFLSP
jgi:hypothetical protein